MLGRKLVGIGTISKSPAPRPTAVRSLCHVIASSAVIVQDSRCVVAWATTSATTIFKLGMAFGAYATHKARVPSISPHKASTDTGSLKGSFGLVILASIKQ